jgi:O-methyltransferase
MSGKKFLQSLINSLLRPVGAELVRKVDVFHDLDPAIRQIYKQVEGVALGNPEGIFVLCEALAYLKKARVPGSFVECGVYRGGGSMAAALMMRHLNDTRDMHLYDTFEGMPPATAKDMAISTGKKVYHLKATGETWTKAEEAEVRANMATTGYDMARVAFHRGKVEESLPQKAPGQISLLRLDTDWYESTKHELIHLWPRLVKGGVLIIDDYGHFTGVRDAVDEYFGDNPLFLARVDYKERIAIKP